MNTHRTDEDERPAEVGSHWAVIWHTAEDRQRIAALAAVRDYLMDEWVGPLYQVIGDGEELAAWEDATSDDLTRIIETTDDDVTSQGARGSDPHGLVALYRQVIDALAPDGGAARRAGHLLHWPDARGHCTTAGCGWREEGSECREAGHVWGPPEYVAPGYWNADIDYMMRLCTRCADMDRWADDEPWPVGGEVLL